MTREQRAKQFAPFDSLKGLQEALREKEKKHLIENKKDLLDDFSDLNMLTLSILEKDDRVKIKYYLNGFYCDVEGMVCNNDKSNGILEIKNIIINYDDIYSIEKI